MVSFKYSLLILLIAVLDLVRADDGAFIVAQLIKVVIILVVLIIMGVAIYRCIKKNESFYNDGDYTTSQTQIVPATTTTGFTGTGFVSNQSQSNQYSAPQPTQYSAPQKTQYSTTQYGNPQYPPPQPTQYNPQYPPPNQYSTAQSQFNQAPPAYGHGDYDGNHQFGQFTAKY